MKLSNWNKWKRKYDELKHEYEALRERYLPLYDYYVAGTRPIANCDAEWPRRFAELERDYKNLESAARDDAVDAMKWRTLQHSLKGLMT